MGLFDPKVDLSAGYPRPAPLIPPTVWVLVGAVVFVIAFAIFGQFFIALGIVFLLTAFFGAKSPTTMFYLFIFGILLLFIQAMLWG